MAETTKNPGHHHPKSIFPQLKHDFITGNLLAVEKKEARYLFAIHCSMCQECREAVIEHQKTTAVKDTIKLIAVALHVEPDEVLRIMGVLPRLN